MHWRSAGPQQISPSDKALATAAQCGDHLIVKAQRVESGLGWFNNIETVKPITGFAHGAAGIAWALLELAARTGNKKYRDTALEAMAYEHGQYSSATGNWTDNAGESEQTGAFRWPGAMAPRALAWPEWRP